MLEGPSEIVGGRCDIVEQADTPQVGRLRELEAKLLIFERIRYGIQEGDLSRHGDTFPRIIQGARAQIRTPKERPNIDPFSPNQCRREPSYTPACCLPRKLSYSGPFVRSALLGKCHGSVRHRVRRGLRID